MQNEICIRREIYLTTLGHRSPAGFSVTSPEIYFHYTRISVGFPVRPFDTRHGMNPSLVDSIHRLFINHALSLTTCHHAGTEPVEVLQAACKSVQSTEILSSYRMGDNLSEPAGRFWHVVAGWRPAVQIITARHLGTELTITRYSTLTNRQVTPTVDHEEQEGAYALYERYRLTRLFTCATQSSPSVAVCLIHTSH
jgi:hypothetical protein